MAKRPASDNALDEAPAAKRQQTGPAEDDLKRPREREFEHQQRAVAATMAANSTSKEAAVWGKLKGTALVHAAKGGFEWLNKAQVRKLMAVQDPPLPTTASFHDDLKALLKVVLKGWSEERIAEILKQRCKYQEDPLQEAVPQDILDELADDRDGKEVQEHRGNQSKKIKTARLKKNTHVCS